MRRNFMETRLYAPWLAVLFTCAVQGACFSPSYPVDLPCDQDGWCPPGQQCNNERICVLDTGEPFIDASPYDAPPPPELVGISLGGDISLAVGEIHAFVVTQSFSDGTSAPVEVAGLVIWRSTDNNVLWLDYAGLAHAVAEGQVTVTARYEGRVDAVTVTVTPAP